MKSAFRDEVGGLSPAGGIPLPASERSFLEPQFGADLGSVRIHTGSEASAQAESINARAFTLGRHITFGSDQYRPGTEAGRKLLAHEVTHTFQQSTGLLPQIQRKKHTGTADYLDPDDCWRPNVDRGPTDRIIGRFVGILDVPERCAGTIDMTMRFEVIGGWPLSIWLKSSSQLIFSPSMGGTSVVTLPKGTTELGSSYFEHKISYPLTPNNCTNDFEVFLLMAYRDRGNVFNFAEVKFSRVGSWDKGMTETTLADTSPDPVVRVDPCGRLSPSQTGSQSPVPPVP